MMFSLKQICSCSIQAHGIFFFFSFCLFHENKKSRRVSSRRRWESLIKIKQDLNS